MIIQYFVCSMESFRSYPDCFFY